MADETTTDRLAEIEGQAADYPPPEGWRWLQIGEVIRAGDRWVRLVDGQLFDAYPNGQCVRHRRFIRRIEQPQPEPQPVQVREGRWRTRGGDIRNVILTPAEDLRAITYPWHDARYGQTWLLSGRYNTDLVESPLDLWEYLGPIEPQPEPEPQPEQTITPDDVAVEALAGVWDQAKAEQQIAELRSEVSYVQGLLGESQTRVVEQQNLIQELLTMNEVTEPQPQPQPVHLQAMIEAQAETIARLHSEIHDLNLEIGGLQCKRTLDVELQTQLEAVKAELVRQCENSRLLQIELDAREQVPQAVSDRFEEGWDAGTARAVETIAEWTEPFRTCGSQALALAIMQNLPHIMRSLTGLADED